MRNLRLFVQSLPTDTFDHGDQSDKKNCVPATVLLEAWHGVALPFS
jgi:hypothetical protein